MKPDPRAQRIIAMMSMSAASGPPDLRQRREGFARLMQMGEKPFDIPVRRNVAGGPVPMRLYDGAAARNEAAPALLFFHGGGLVAGSIDTHDGICRRLAAHSGLTVISVGYRLAPEHRYPAALEDAQSSLEWLMGHAEELGLDAMRLAIGGESAGALLAALLAHVTAATASPPRAQLFLCPVMDLAGTAPSRQTFGTGYLIDAATVEADIVHCLGPGRTAAEIPSALRLSGASPLPTVLVTAGCDPFHDEAVSYAEQLQQRGVPVRHMDHPGMIHSFYGLPALLPQAEPALEGAARALAVLMA